MYSWLWNYVKPHRFKIVWGLLLTAVAAGLSLVGAPLSGQLVDKVILNGEHGLLFSILGLLVGLTLLKLVIRYIFQMIFEFASQDILRNIREDMYRHLQRLDMGFFDKTKTGDLMAHMTGDMDAIRHFHSWVVYQIFENALIFLLSMALLFYINWIFTLVLLAVTPCIAWAAIRLSREVKPTFGKIREQFSRLNSVVQEYIAGNRVVKAFAREDYEAARFAVENDGFRDRSLESARVWGKYIPYIEFFSGCLMVVMITVGGILVVDGALTIGELVVFSGLIWAITNPLRMSGWLINDFRRFTASLERVFSLARTEGNLPVNEFPVLPVPAESFGIRVPLGRIEFRHVRFGYGVGSVLEDIDLIVEAGQTIGILGPTGSGKSTLMRLLCRHFDCESGQILVDGVDVRDYDPRALRRRVGITMQDVFLFSDTIEGNIAFADPEADMDRVLNASKLANADAFVSGLAEGYDTIVGERGVGLSGGQRQRVALARLLLAAPPIMILDDTTSAVDVETEARIQQTVRGLHGKHTIFIVAHRLSSVIHADTIVVLDQGRIVQRGTHQELLASPGYYREVWDHQCGTESAIHGTK